MRYLLLITCFCLVSCSTTQVINTGFGIARASNISPKILERGIQEVLLLSGQRALQSLSQPGAYGSSGYRIGLPEQFSTITTLMDTLGFASQIQHIESLINKSAEMAASESKSLLTDATNSMKIEDAIGIIQGGNTAATDYLKQQTSHALSLRYRDIISQQLKKIGYNQEYSQLLNMYKKVPFVEQPNLDVESFIVERSLNSLFSQIAIEEKLIRQDPVGKGSALIAQVFAVK